MTFDEHVARRDAERAAADAGRVTWRRAILPGGQDGWSGLGVGGALVYVRKPRVPRWDGARYEYGTIEGKVSVNRGGARTLAAAKSNAAAALLNRDLTNAAERAYNRDMTTTEEAPMTEQTPLVYGSPEAKAQIRKLRADQDSAFADVRAVQAEMKALRDGAKGRALTADEQAAHKALYERERALVVAWSSAKRERVALQTRPLPVASDWDLPARMLDREESHAAVPGPQDAAAYHAGDLVVVYSRGGWREAVVVHAAKSRVEVAYTTATAVREAREWDRSGPTVTRKTVAFRDVYNHRPTAPAAAATPEEGTMSKDEQTKTQAGTSRRKSASSRSTKSRAKKAPATPAAAPEPVVALPASDPTPPSGDELSTAFLATVAETLADVEAKPSPKGDYTTLRVGGKPIGYVNHGARRIRVEARQADGSKTSYPVQGVDDFAAAVSALAASAGATVTS